MPGRKLPRPDDSNLRLYRIRTAKHTVDGGREASLEIVRPVSASGSKLWV